MSDESLARCITIDHKTPVIGNVGFADQLYKDAKGLVFTDGNTGMSIDRQYARLGAGEPAKGLLKKQKIGIVATDGNPLH